MFDNNIYLDGGQLYGQLNNLLANNPVFGNPNGRIIVLLHYSDKKNIQSFSSGSYWTTGITTSCDRISRLTNVPNINDICSLYAMKYGLYPEQEDGDLYTMGAEFTHTSRTTSFEVQIFPPIPAGFVIELPFAAGVDCTN